MIDAGILTLGKEDGAFLHRRTWCTSSKKSTG